MDLMRLLPSLEEFLYELVGWLVFYPRTLWRIFRHPGAIARYTRAELAKDSEDKFTDTISPVLMLILSVVLAHAFEMASRLPMPKADSPVGRLAFGSDEGLLLTRSVVFCIFALGASLGTLRRGRQAITRDTLREPFSIQAFLVCPFVVLLSLGTLMARDARPWVVTLGVGIAMGSALWYIGARTVAYHALYGGGWFKPLLSVLAWFVMTTLAILALAFVVV